MTVVLSGESEIEREHHEAMAALEAAQMRCDRALAESDKVRDLFPHPAGEAAPASADRQIPTALVLAIDGALGRYTACLRALSDDDSKETRARCEAALAEYDRLKASAALF